MLNRKFAANGRWRYTFMKTPWPDRFRRLRFIACNNHSTVPGVVVDSNIIVAVVSGGSCVVGLVVGGGVEGGHAFPHLRVEYGLSLGS